VAQKRGVGAEWEATLGGVRDTRFARPITLSVKVGRLFDATFVLSGHLAERLPIDMGPSAGLRDGHIHIVVTPRTRAPLAPQLIEAAGLAPFEASVLVAKSPCGFRAVYQSKASRIISVAGPGCAPSDFWTWKYDHAPSPLWPWEDVAGWVPKVELFGQRRE